MAWRQASPDCQSSGGDAASPLLRVAIIGAGFAGLSAARTLTSAGVQCVVLEGSTEVGGRARAAQVRALTNSRISDAVLAWWGSGHDGGLSEVGIVWGGAGASKL
jgi:uncharacterized protein with NAD-binding domain and iron-sulfur cluster